MIFTSETEKIVDKRCVIHCFSLQQDIDDEAFEHAFDAYKLANVTSCKIVCDEKVKFIKSITELNKAEQDSSKYTETNEMIVSNSCKTYEPPLEVNRHRLFKIYLVSDKKFKVIVQKQIQYIPAFQILYNVGRPI